MNHRPAVGYPIKASRFVTWLVIVCLAGVIMLSGCSSLPIAERVTAINFFVFYVPKHPQTLGIGIFLCPLDSKDRIVEAPGSLDAKLWSQNFGNNGKGKLLQEWIGIQVTPESYEPKRGAGIWLQFYKDYESYTGFFQPVVLEIGYTGYYEPSYIIEHIQPASMGKFCNSLPNRYILEIAFTLDGKTLICTKTDLYIGIIVK